MAENKKTSSLQRLARVTGYVLSTVLGLAIALQLLLWGGFHWLNGSGGQNWLLKQLDTAMQGSGYTAKLNGLHMSVIGTLSADGWQVGDAEGTIAEGKNLQLNVSLSAALAKTLALRLHADSASLLRLPKARDAAKPPTGPFALPDFYFRRIALKSFKVDALKIDKSVSGREITFSPDLTGDGSVTATGAKFNLSGSLAALNNAELLAPFLPGKISAKGSFDGQARRISLDEFSATASAYTVQAKGAMGLGGEDDVSFTAEIANDDLAAASGALLAGKAAARLEISGTVSSPRASLSGKLTQLVYGGHHYPDLTLEASAQDIASVPSGTFAIETARFALPAKVVGDFSLKGASLAFDNLNATAPETQLTAEAVYDTGSGLINGHAEGAGSLAPYQKLAGIDASGKAKLSLSLAAREGKQAAKIGAHVSSFAYRDLRLGQGDLQLDLADLWQRWPDAVDLKVGDFKAGEVSLPAATFALSRTGAAAYGFTTKGTAICGERFGFNGKGDISGTDWQNIHAENLSLSLTPAKGSILLTGGADAKSLDLSAALKNLSLSQLPSGLARAATSGTIRIQGPLAAPEMTGDTHTALTQPAVGLDVKSSYRGGKLSISLAGKGKGIQEISAALATPMHLSLLPWEFSLPENSGLAGKIAVRGDAGALSPLVLETDQSLQGQFAAQLDVSGGMAKPEVAGPVSLSNGQFTARSLGVALQGISLKAALNKDSIRIDSLTATDGRKGKLKASGTAQRSNGAAKIDVVLRNMDVSRFNENVTGTISADLGLTGGASGYVLKGKVTPDDLAITIPERFRSDIPKLNILKARGRKPAVAVAGAQALALNILIDAPERVMVRGWGLDAEFGGRLDVTGTAAAPQANGTLQSRRGRYEEFGKRFNITRAILQFNGPMPPSPYLDVLAEMTAEDITGQVTLTGPVSKPAIAFSSVPALPQDEVLSRILFGKSMEKISPFQAIQLARTLQRFSGKGGGPDPLGALRGATGLDDIDVQSSAEGGTTVGAGKYITDKVYLEVGSGTGKKAGAAKVQVELTPKVKLESKIGQDSQAGAGITWGWDY